MSIDQWGREWKVDQEFGSELAGQRIGWAALTEGRTGEDRFQVNIVTTTISDSGATIEHEVPNGEFAPQVRTEGFEDTLAWTLMLDNDEDEDWRRYYTTVNWSAVDNTSRAIELAADVSRNVPEELKAKREWTTDTTELLPTIKAALAERGLERHYPLVYYTTNVLVAHEALLDWTTSREYRGPTLRPMPQYQLPDPSMREQTTEQIALCKKVAEAYGSQAAAGPTLKAVLLKPTAAEVYAAYAKSTSAAEAEAQKARRDIAVQFNFLRLRADNLAFPTYDPPLEVDAYPLGKLHTDDLDKLSGFSETLQVYTGAAKERQKHFSQVVSALGMLAVAEAE